MPRAIFEGQLTHAALLAALLAPAIGALRLEGFAEGAYGGLTTQVWYAIAIAVPIAHQLYVWFWWRLALHAPRLKASLGTAAFPAYASGFAVFFLGRFVTLSLLAAANSGSLSWPNGVRSAAAVVPALLSGYLFYSVARYFSFPRAAGIDHFDPAYRQLPLVRQGIFRYTRNGMYTFGLLAVWLPGVVASSKAALAAAAFQHAYIWVHYFCTEKPDMRRIYPATTLHAPARDPSA